MRKTLSRQLPTSIALGVLLSWVGIVGAGENPYLQPDESWIRLSGTVDSVSRDHFDLNYGDGKLITVEMDDGDRDADAYKLFMGDEVTVSGRIDSDFFELTTIEAAYVHVKKLGTYFYASARDEEGDLNVPVPDPFTPLDADILASDAEAVIYGTVTATHDDGFELATGEQTLNVTVEDMTYDPLDDVGFQKIREGQQVCVRGEIDHNLFEGREFEADWVVTMHGNGR